VVGYHFAGLLSSGPLSLDCWGDDTTGELGNGQTSGQPFASPVASTSVTGALASIDQLEMGFYTSCALSKSDVYCWGGDDDGECGFDAGVSAGKINHVLAPTDPVEFKAGGTLSSAIAIAIGWYFGCALDKTGTVYCWGRNASGQLGNGNIVTPQFYATMVQGTALPATGLTGVTAGSDFACAYEASGLYCWGDNSLGELGIGYANSSYSTAEPITDLPTNFTIASVAAGGGHLCALSTTGDVVCWGNNPSGQIGDGTPITNPHPTPAAPIGLPAVTQVATGGDHTCAVTTTGDLYCWGSNSSGQLGVLNTGAMSAVPVLVIDGGVASVALGFATSCALLTNGEVECWGANDVGEVGNGSPAATEITPMVVGPFP